MKRKVALVTGASRGIGKSCAVHLDKAAYGIELEKKHAAVGVAFPWGLLATYL